MFLSKEIMNNRKKVSKINLGKEQGVPRGPCLLQVPGLNE